MRDSKTIIGAIFFYILGALICFGLSFNLQHVTNEKMPSTADMDNTMRAMSCAIAWPLWVSVQASKSLLPQRTAQP